MVSSFIITCSEAWLCKQHPREVWGNQSVTAPSTGEKGSEVIVSAAKPASAQHCVCISCSWRCPCNDSEMRDIMRYAYSYAHKLYKCYNYHRVFKYMLLWSHASFPKDKIKSDTLPHSPLLCHTLQFLWHSIIVYHVKPQTHILKMKVCKITVRVMETFHYCFGIFTSYPF